MQIMMDKDQLLVRLGWQLTRAVEFDREVTAKHKADEKAWLEKSRAGLRELIKLSYDELKAVQNRNGYITLARPPECPLSMVVKYDSAIEQVTLSNQKTYTLTSDGVHRYLHSLVVWDPNPARADVC